MKRTVDLTVNREFMKIGSNQSKSLLQRYLKKQIFPWSIEAEVRQNDLYTNDLLLTGNGSVRKKQKEQTAFEKTCHCCGRWDSFHMTITKSTLCKSCEVMLDQSVVGNVPWRVQFG
ncbi:hypothetical protein [Bacillus atrophaeus]|uniref:hypothetical protein n=1 Tax=Bacillus atrophaeus TaxID=1452 RepID=UPI002DB6130C|nr:hypothetical protein [Bacillus atrophaeus]MEC2307680.1 hypothetical protein [Bacillus atrophaeus]